MENYIRKDKLRVAVLNSSDETDHFHQDIELLYILEGSMEVTIGEQKSVLNQDDLLIINTNRKHTLKCSKNILYAMVSIEYELISDIFQSMDIIFWCDSTRDESERFNELRSAMKQLLKHYLSTQDGVMNFGHIALCYQVMNILSVHFLVQPMDKENSDDKNKFDYRLAQINAYIRANFNQPISMKTLSEKLYLSNGYLSRFFKKVYGMSFAEYITSIRLYHAMEDLLYTTKPITRIAYDNGFPSSAVFNRTFKKAYNKTPSSVREKAKKHAKESKNQGDSNSSIIQERLNLFLQRKEDTLNNDITLENELVEHSVKNSTEINPLWSRIINIGEAEELLSAQVREHLIVLKKRMGFEYVRFWNIFSEALLMDISQKEGKINFTRLDSILDFIVQEGLKPHIELGQKPKRINKNVQTFILCNNATKKFESLERWDWMIDTIFSHVVHRYGRLEVDSWKVEIWYNEQHPNDHETIDVYFEVFNRSYEIIRRYSEKIEIGGCGIQTNYTIYLKQQFLQQWMQQKYRPDFISVLNFAYVRGKENLDIYSKRSTDVDFLLHGLQSVKADMEAVGMSKTKLYVSEWNLTISDRNYINDTCFKGAYIVKNMIDVFGEVDGIGYFLGSDCVTEHFDSGSLLYGGMGLLTKNGILKPAGYAFELLNRLYPFLVARGTQYIITTNQQNSYGMICHNMKNLNYNYYFTKEDEIEKEQLWKYFEDREVQVLRLNLCDVENGDYLLKTYRVNEQNGSIIDIWADMSYTIDLEREELEYLKKVCEPRVSLEKIEVKQGMTSIEITLEPNEIAIISMSKAW